MALTRLFNVCKKIYGAIVPNVVYSGYSKNIKKRKLKKKIQSQNRNSRVCKNRSAGRPSRKLTQFDSIRTVPQGPPLTRSRHKKNPSEQLFQLVNGIAEVTCLLTFDERLDSFSATEMATVSRSSRLMEAAEITNSSILPTDQGLQMWRLFETPTYKCLRKAQEYTESIALELISKRVRKTNSKNSLTRTSFVEEFLKNPNLDLVDIVGITADLLLAGIDTTSYTTAFALYHIQKNIRKHFLRKQRSPAKII